MNGIRLTAEAALVFAGAVTLAIWGNELANGQERHRLKWPNSLEPETVQWHVHAHPVLGGFLLTLGVVCAVSAFGWGVYGISKAGES